jgi:hypothetical protein
LVDMALLLGWLQVEDYGALLGLLTQPNEVPLMEGKDALADAGLYVELVRIQSPWYPCCMLHACLLITSRVPSCYCGIVEPFRLLRASKAAGSCNKRGVLVACGCVCRKSAQPSRSETRDDAPL